MNNAFLLPDHGAIARRLVRLAKILPITLDPAIEEVARRDLLPDAIIQALHDLTPGAQAACQTLADMGSRALVVAEQADTGIRLLLSVLAAGSVARTLILTENPDAWQRWADVHELAGVHVGSHDQVEDGDLIDSHRSGAFIADFCTARDVGAARVPFSVISGPGLFCEFAHSYVMVGSPSVGRDKAMNDQIIARALHALFPSTPEALTSPGVNRSPIASADLEDLGFSDTCRRTLLTLTNTVFC